jgi:DNA-binding MarR family transcriptional regulator
MNLQKHIDPPSIRFREAYWRAMYDLDNLRLQHWEHSQVTLPQLRVLFQVSRSPGITTGQLAQFLSVTVSTTSGLVAKLVAAGLVARGHSLSDRRQIPLEPTDAGLALASELSGFTRSYVESLAHELGPGLEDVIASLESLAEAGRRVRERAG